MRTQLIKGGDNQLFEIVEDDQNDEVNTKLARQVKLHRYDGQLDKLSKVTKDVLTKNKK